ncbi:MAG: ATP-binding cassette domain-containing protein [Treponema sp.]|jgi:zinc transport system ATP-binding protein|nr:ATP-binding cassette domain-containing protein [Treponema sp.]
MNGAGGGKLIAAERVSLGYEGRIVLKDLSFSLDWGDYLCVVGENGSGKTTLVKGILGLLNPAQGSLRVGLRAREIGYLSQEAAAKDDFPAGVLEIVLSAFLGGMGLRPFYSPGEKREAEERLRQMGAADLKNRCYRELSGGQRRRVLLARALCGGKKLLVLDEPASGLDPLVREDLYALLQKINREGISIVMVTHDTEAARKYANRILSLRRDDVYYFS